MSSSTSPEPWQHSAPPPPQEGQLFRDGTGRLWRVEALITEASPGTFYLVDLMPGPSPHTGASPQVLTPREFAQFTQRLALKPV